MLVKIMLIWPKKTPIKFILTSPSGSSANSAPASNANTQVTLLAATIQKDDIQFSSAGKHFRSGKSSFPGRKSKYGVLVQLNRQRQCEQKGLQFLELVSCMSYFGIQAEKAVLWCQRKGAHGRLSFNGIGQEQSYVGCAWGISSLWGLRRISGCV